MKKQFLLLLLSTLLPLAGWAQTDLSDGWEIVFDPAGPVTYTGSNQTPAVKLKKGGSYLETGFNVQWSSAEIINAGSYTVTVTADNTNTYDDLAVPTKKFWVLKANAAITTAPVLAADKDYDGEDYTLVTNVAAAAASFGTIEYVESETTPAANAAWSTASPVASAAGAHQVWYRVVGTDNFNGIDPTLIGTVTIEGAIPTFTAPTPKVGLLYTTQAQELIAAGTATGGTMQYSLDGTNWSTSIPTGTNAGDYTVYYKVVGDESHKDIAPANFGVSIAKGTPVITAPAGATDLTFNGQNQNILKTAATATLGATVVYDVAYKAPGAADYDAAVETTEANMSFKNAGDYQITAKVNGNDNLIAVAATGDDIKVVTIAQKAAAAPTAVEGLVYNKEAQNLITAGEAGIVKYSTDGGANWVNVVDDIKGTNAGDYNVLYKVEDANYQAVAATTIPNVKIAKAFLTIVVKDLEKTYDHSTTLPALGTNYEAISQVDDYDLTGMNYAATAKKNAGVYENELGVVVPNAAANNNYEINIVKGKLTINKAKLTVTANQPLSCDMNQNVATYIKNEYSVASTGVLEASNVVWTKTPVLTSNAPTPLVPGDYTLSFTKGTLKSANYEMDTEAGDGGYVIPDGAKLTVTPAAESKVVITVVGHEKTYGEADPDYTQWVAGTDYYVSGLQGGDAIKTIEFSRAEGENVGEYALNAVATVNHPEWYAGDIVYNNAKLTINKKALTATVDEQYFTVGTEATELDQNAWSVEGLAFEDTKAVLGATPLTVVEAAAIDGEGKFVEGIYTIRLTIANDGNYILDNDAYTQTFDEKLYVINAQTLVIDDSKADNSEQIAAADGKHFDVVNVKFASRNGRDLGGERKWGQYDWMTLTLPFDISVAELSQTLGYAIVNVIDASKTVVNATESQFFGKLTMTGGNGKDNVLAANKPFMVKTAGDIGDGFYTFYDKTIVAPASAADLTVDAGEGATFVGTYAPMTVTKADDAKKWFLIGGGYTKWAYITSTSSATWNLMPTEAYIQLPIETQSIVFNFEDVDGGTTAIKSIDVDNLSGKVSAEGWYTLNGMKLQTAPTEKGVYIKDGKKVVIK